MLGDKACNLERAASYIDRAAEQDAGLVLFPEMYLTGYLLQENTRELAETVSGTSIKKKEV
jgi:predicted amidohydrolase